MSVMLFVYEPTLSKTLEERGARTNFVFISRLHILTRAQIDKEQKANTWFEFLFKSHSVLYIRNLAGQRHNQIDKPSHFPLFCLYIQLWWNDVIQFHGVRKKSLIIRDLRYDWQREHSVLSWIDVSNAYTDYLRKATLLGIAAFTVVSKYFLMFVFGQELSFGTRMSGTGCCDKVAHSNDSKESVFVVDGPRRAPLPGTFHTKNDVLRIRQKLYVLA